MQLMLRSSSALCASAGIVRILAPALLATGLALPMPAIASEISELPELLQEKVDQALQACSDVENGQFALEWGAVTRVDLDGDLRPDWVLNEAFFACSSAVSLYCGTGGCMSHFLVGGQLGSLLNQGWEMADIGRHRVILAEADGSQCGDVGPSPCVTASVWDAEVGVWRSTDAAWEKVATSEPDPDLVFVRGYRSPSDECQLVGESAFTIEFLDDASDLVACPTGSSAMETLMAETGTQIITQTNSFTFFSLAYR